MAGGAPMKDAVAAYLALRRAAGFEMANAEYLLGSFAQLCRRAERNPRPNANRDRLGRSRGIRGATRRAAESGLSVRPSRPRRR